MLDNYNPTISNEIDSSCQIRSEINFKSDNDLKYTLKCNDNVSTPSHLSLLVTYIQCSYFTARFAASYLLSLFRRSNFDVQYCSESLKRYREYAFKWSMLHLANFKRLTCIT